MIKRMNKNTILSLEKAKQCAMLALEIYNKPATLFKSGGYIILMVISWTALFHAIFFKRKVKPYYRKRNDNYHKGNNPSFNYLLRPRNHHHGVLVTNGRLSFLQIT